jgi:guanosine-3',5'-bis(diphosphate) 3'-pyrophosphohydrolase
MGLPRLLETVKEYSPKSDLDTIELAYDFAEKAHEGQKRASGEPYINHSVETAITLAKLRLPENMIIAGLLHDVPEDTTVTLADIKKEFGEDVASMVGGITKLGKIKYRGMDRYVENLRKMFVAMASDIRVILIKFADRLHNLSTLDALPARKRVRIALESLEIYAPIANRLGMGFIQGRIEDLSFKYVYPKEYAWVSGLVKDRYRAKERYLKKVGEKIVAELKKNEIGILDIHGRTKHLYSLHKKLMKYDRNLDKIYDLVALRVIVPTVADCYATLGIIHQMWKPLKGRIKDYIAQPKPNGYQSLHTTVFCDGGEIVEVQIRTEQMHQESEYGIAAHWHYVEEGKESPAAVDAQIAWVKDLIKLQQESLKDSGKLLESVEKLKIDVFQKRIFVFTPSGDVIDLPEDASPIDFAYAIHSDIGDKCTAARINNEIAPLDARLYSGDMCEIVIDKNRKGPNPDWLKFAKTHHAKDRIKTYAKKKRLG